MNNLYVLLKNGFEEIEALTIVDYLRRAEVKVVTVSMEEKIEVEGGHQIKVKADKLFSDINKEDIDIVYIPGGLPAAEGLKEDERVIDLLKHLDEEGKLIASMCAGPMVLNKAGLLADKTATSYPGLAEEIDNVASYSEEAVVKSKNVITSRGPATAVLLALALIEEVKGENVRKEIEEDILFNYIKC